MSQTVIKQQDFIDSIYEAIQFISYYHPRDFLEAMKKAYDAEQNPSAKAAIAQILVNSKMCAIGHRPLCQDTGAVTCFVKIGMDVRFDGDMTVQEMVDEGTRRAYCCPTNPLRKSILVDPAGKRVNTKDNTPAVVHIEMVHGNKVEVAIASKGGGSENKTHLKMLNPSDSIVDWVLSEIPQMGAGWCPPGIIGIGVGGTPEKSAILAKEALNDPIDIQELIKRGPKNADEELRLELYDKINKLGIGAQGLGGITTVLDVKVKSYPCHAVSKATTIIPNCAATRHIDFELDGSGPATFTPPSLDDYPDIEIGGASANVKRVNLDTLTKEEMATWKMGDTLLLTGTILTGRDAAHKRICDMIERGEPLPEGVDFHGKMIYYVGPVPAVGDEVIGPAGPTTSTRMDKFVETMLSKTGLFGMIGKSERGPAAVESIKKHGAAYLMAVGGAAYLVSKAIKSARVLAFEDLGMEAIHEFKVVDMPVTVAVDSQGNNIHAVGPKIWSEKIREIGFKYI
ncbi:MAG TPA: fumarate hydratase [Candidatus Avisuccinivibrio pullicola]|nr:fumarate hydratase [Candidatus Avisuccinivibrio pullicola]